MTRVTSVLALLFWSTTILLVPSLAAAQSSTDEPVRYWSVRPSFGELGESPVTDKVATQPVPPSATAAQRGAEFVFAPIPIVNPTLDNGLAVAVGELYTIDRGSPPSGTLGMGFYAF